MFPYEIETAPRNVKKKKRSGVAGFTVVAIDIFYESSEVAFSRYHVIFKTDCQLIVSVATYQIKTYQIWAYEQIYPQTRLKSSAKSRSDRYILNDRPASEKGLNSSARRLSISRCQIDSL
jgi:hypothetical protein